MEKADFNFIFTANKPLKSVFNDLTDVRKWWTGLYEETITGKSQKIGDEFTFKAGGGIHVSKQRLTELQPDVIITWKVTESTLGFLKNTAEWTGTSFGFHLHPDGNRTKVTFTHRGLTPSLECYDNCSSAWSGYMINLMGRLS